MINDERLAIEAIRQNVRQQCLLGGNGRYGLEVLCGILGYNDMGEFHHKQCALIEGINPFVADRAIKRAEFKNDDLQEARSKLAARYDESTFTYDSLKRIWLWSRGHFKTSLISYAHTIQIILIDPNIRIFLMHHKLEKAKDILRVIKEHFMMNDRFRHYFPEFCPQAGKNGDIVWDTSERVTVVNRTVRGWQEPTIDVGGVNTLKTGAHYDYIKKDDLVTEDSVTNETMLQQSIDADAMTKSLFDIPEKGPEDYIGTRYHFGDMYSHKLRSIPKNQQSIVPCFDEEGNVVFHERFSKEGLDNIRKDQGSYVFSCQYNLNPIDPAAQIFNKNWIQWYDKLPENLYTYLCVDPASAKKKRSDYTAMLVIGVDNNNNWYICDVIRDKLNVTERVDSVWELANKWKVLKVLYESVGFQETDIHLIKERKHSEPYKFGIVEIKTHGVSKIDRIRGLQPMYERGQIFWPREIRRFSKYESKVMDYIQALTMEMETFPMSEHDDLLDAHSMILQINIQKPHEGVEVKRLEPGSYGAMLREHRRKNKKSKLIENYKSRTGVFR